MAPPASGESVSLAAGVALALRQLRLNAKDATAYNVRIIAREKALLLLLLLPPLSPPWTLVQSVLLLLPPFPSPSLLVCEATRPRRCRL